MPKYTRPGVEAAVRLAAIRSRDAWERIEAQYSDMIVKKGQKKLKTLDEARNTLGAKLRKKKPPVSISVDELLLVVEWKFLKGKPRHALMKHLKSNTAKQVILASKGAFAKASQDDARGAVEHFCALKGVGPATASAFLSLYRPDIFAFMDDEVIECLHEGKRGYTLKIYLEVNGRCQDIAKALGDGWTPCRVGGALWTAARVCASGGEDLTVDFPCDGGTRSGKEQDQNTQEKEDGGKERRDTRSARAAKRQKR